jgi:serine/threonine protein kinase
MAPEVLFGNEYQIASEWWSFGCLVYEMLTGQPPFMTKSSQEKLFKKIKYQQPDLKLSYLSKDSIDLLQHLLEKDPQKRLGSGPEGFKQIMNHQWFSKVDWSQLYNKQCISPYKPQLDKDTDLKYFSEDFTNLKISSDDSNHC